MEVARAPRVRFSQHKQYFFCSDEHAELFSFSSSAATGVASAAQAAQPGADEQGAAALVAPAPLAPTPIAVAPVAAAPALAGSSQAPRPTLEKPAGALTEAETLSRLRRLGPSEAVWLETPPPPLSASAGATRELAATLESSPAERATSEPSAPLSISERKTSAGAVVEDNESLEDEAHQISESLEDEAHQISEPLKDETSQQPAFAAERHFEIHAASPEIIEADSEVAPLEAELPPPSSASVAPRSDDTSERRMSRENSAQSGLNALALLSDLPRWIAIFTLALTLIAAAGLALSAAPYLAALAALMTLAAGYLLAEVKPRGDELEAEKALAELSRLLRHPARVVRDGNVQKCESDDVRAGEEVLVQVGEVVPVDGIVASGSGELELWTEGAAKRLSIDKGARVIAGARLATGQLELVASKSGSTRSLDRLRAQASLLGPVLIARRIAYAGAPLIALLVAVMLHLQGGDWLHVLLAGATTAGAFSLPLAVRFIERSALSSLVAAAKSGIVYCHPQVVDRAGQVSTAVFCARGTVLNGEPDVAEIHVFRETDEARVLALAAGAESAVHHPIAAATLRAASQRNIAVDVCRGHRVSPGLGVLCVTSDGRPLVVGSRELLLKERVSVALAEDTLRVLEARGLSTLLVAEQGHLVGILALQDSLRVGARASFQLLHDVGIEPVLLSGDSRVTTEAVAHSLSCEHVRPEVPLQARAQEIHSLAETGAVVAVVGASPRDDVALGAAAVPIILDGAAVVRRDSPHAHERGVGLTSNRVKDAALALLWARHIRISSWMMLICWLLPTILAAALVASSLLPAVTVPLSALLGAAVAVGLTSLRKKRGLSPPPPMWHQHVRE